MRAMWIICGMVMFSAALLGQQDAPEAAEDSLRTLFTAQVQQWMDAYNSGDTANLAPLYAVDAEYISSHVDGLVAGGREKLLANFQKGMRMGGHIDAIEILSIQHSCDLVTLTCAYRATNSGEKASGRNLLVLRKINGVWLIQVHMTVV